LGFTDGLLVVSAAVHAAAAVFYVALYRRSGLLEHRAVSRFAGAFCGYVLGSAVVAHPTTWVAAPAALFLWLTGSLSVAGLVELCAVLSGQSAAAQQ
jgi:hypothetical protein